MSKLKSATEIVNEKHNHEPKILRIFVLEDDGKRGEHFMKLFINHRLTICNCAPDAIPILESMKFDIIFLDHDLGGQTYVDSSKENCGMELVRYLVNLGPNSHTPVIIHSWNTIAAKAMKHELVNNDGFAGQVECAFFGDTDFNNICSNIVKLK